MQRSSGAIGCAPWRRSGTNAAARGKCKRSAFSVPDARCRRMRMFGSTPASSNCCVHRTVQLSLYLVLGSPMRRGINPPYSVAFNLDEA